MTDKNIISEQILYFRNKFGLTQEQLADKIDVSKQTISNWETGLKTPRMGAIQKMADLFGVSKGRLIEGPQDTDSIDSKAKLLAAHIDDDVSDEEMAQILDYIELVKKANRN